MDASLPACSPLLKPYQRALQFCRLTLLAIRSDVCDLCGKPLRVSL